MDLIYTNAKRVDQGVLAAYGFDLSFGDEENDFEMTLDNKSVLDFGALIYIEGTEYGGIVDGLKTGTESDTITYIGRTWHGVLNSKVIEPDAGEGYFTVSGDAHEILSALIPRLGLSGMFTADSEPSGINIPSYQFTRYCKAYDGIRAMLSANGAKLKIVWRDRSVILSAVPIADYTDSPVDGDIAALSVEQHQKMVNHLICLGRGELASREIIHLYVDGFGKISTTQYYKGLDEVTDTYDYSNAESFDDLKKGGITRLKELRDKNKAEISLTESSGLSFDIGDIVGATEQKTGISVATAVTQKIVKINNGVINTEYKTGG